MVGIRVKVQGVVRRGRSVILKTRPAGHSLAARKMVGSTKTLSFVLVGTLVQRLSSSERGMVAGTKFFICIGRYTCAL